jgi:hypothetical protein
MRACFLGENVCALGFGVAIVQTPPLHEPESGEPPVSFPADLLTENQMAREWQRRHEMIDPFLTDRTPSH